MRPKIIVKNISKSYQLYNKQSDKLIDLLFPFKRNNNNLFYALNGISFEVNEGETVGIIGTNGSGKSTLSNILAGVIPPSNGDLYVDGETSLIAINAGLRRGLSGLDNIELKLLMLGFSKEEILEKTPLIIEFADIGNFIEQPVKNYSSGMKSRLGFAISAYTNPDILIVDEALSVGDKTFYEKCLAIINRFKEEGKTIFFISHSIGQMRSISDRVLWLDFGEVREYGNAKEVLDHYEEYIKWFNSLSKEEKKQYKENKRLEQENNRLFVKRTRGKSDKLSISFILQILVLFIYTLTGAFFMFSNSNPAASEVVEENNSNVETPSHTENLENEEDDKQDNKIINREGIVISKNSSLYTDKNMTEEVTTTEFLTQLYILEQVDDKYKVQYEEEELYIWSNEVVFLESTTNSISDFGALDLYPILPQALVPSYEFFLVQLGVEYNEVKEGLAGYTDEGLLDNRAFLEYGLYEVKYIFNENQIAESMVVSNIDLNDPLLEDLKAEANVVSKDEMIFYSSIVDYDVIVDIENSIMALTLRDS